MKTKAAIVGKHKVSFTTLRFIWNEALDKAINRVAREVNVILACNKDITNAKIIELVVKEIDGLKK